MPLGKNEYVRERERERERVTDNVELCAFERKKMRA